MAITVAQTTPKMANQNNGPTGKCGTAELSTSDFRFDNHQAPRIGAVRLIERTSRNIGRTRVAPFIAQCVLFGVPHAIFGDNANAAMTIMHENGSRHFRYTLDFGIRFFG